MVEEVAIKLGTTKIKGIRTNSHSGEQKEVTLTVGTRYYECINGEKWPSFYIKEGAITGYESFHITEESILDLSYGWCACMGTKDRWDRLYIESTEMRKAFHALELLPADWPQ